MKDRIHLKDLNNYIGKDVTLAGWIDTRRDHGKLIFIDLRDTTGLVQMVSSPKNEDAHLEADKLRPEWVVKITGEVKERPEKMVNPDEINGNLEIGITDIEVINQAETPPFELSGDGYGTNEEIRMRYRYLDLRRKRMSENIKKRGHVISFFRQFLTKHNFNEIETPALTSSSPEGARDYVVPSRIDVGKFYALPQAPQQFKQMLMVSGFERYFQVARCFRDEDTRGDRQPEFTQLDIEMSFVNRNEIMEFVEKMFTEMVESLYPNKKITKKPWPRITYREAMEKYKTDRPDFRENKEDPDELAFGWVIDFPLFDEEELKEKEQFAPSHHMFTAPHPEDIDRLDEDPGKVRSTQMDMVLNGFEVGGGSIRIHDADTQSKIFDLIGFTEKEKQSFQHMLTAFSYGAPPHGGIAPGLDRVMMILQNEETIREVIAFPKTGEGRDLMMNAPSDISEEQLKELGLKIVKSKNNSRDRTKE